MSYFLRIPIRTNKGREATETEGLELLKFDCCVCVCVCLQKYVNKLMKIQNEPRG